MILQSIIAILLTFAGCCFTIAAIEWWERPTKPTEREPMNRVNQHLAETAETDIHVSCLLKGDERYIFVWTADNREELFRTLGRFASNPELSINWYDVAKFATRIRQAAEVGL